MLYLLERCIDKTPLITVVAFTLPNPLFTASYQPLVCKQIQEVECLQQQDLLIKTLLQLAESLISGTTYWISYILSQYCRLTQIWPDVFSPTLSVFFMHFLHSYDCVTTVFLTMRNCLYTSSLYDCRHSSIASCFFSPASVGLHRWSSESIQALHGRYILLLNETGPSQTSMGQLRSQSNIQDSSFYLPFVPRPTVQTRWKSGAGLSESAV